MADNITLNTGSGGDTLSADDIAGVKVQRVKVQHGADGAATDVSTASPLPVDLRANNLGDVPVTLDGEQVRAAAQSDAMYDGTTSCTVKRFSVVGTTNGNNTLISAVADKKFRILSLAIVGLSATAANVYVVNGDNNLIANSTNKLPVSCDADADHVSGLVLPHNPGGWLQTDTANEALVAVHDSTAPVLYVGTYVEVA
ncbi:MAG TPA: hypothetical protein PLE19_12770 [Planctomycetota bacterium]|nr:hypothetical protein [Planctomycetota bacterium]HRT95764.1 hypothetical protein [Planctomycetota bacterium]